MMGYGVVCLCVSDSGNCWRRCSHRDWSWLKQLSLKFPLNFATGHWKAFGGYWKSISAEWLFERCEWFSCSPAFQRVEQFAKLSDPFSCTEEDTRNLLVSECDLRLGDSWLFIEHPNVSGSGVFRDVFEGRQNGHDTFEQLLCWRECNSVINHDLKNYFGPKIKLKRLKVAA